MLVAIDGTAASGKGTLGKRVATNYGLEYLDTGKLYRAVGYELIQQEADFEALSDFEASSVLQAVEAVKNLNIDLPKEALATEEVGRAASIISAIAEVRDSLLKYQRDFASSPKGAVLDGRDIGTVVCPNADFKFFITATIERRAERRYKQLQTLGKDVIQANILQDLKARDARDSSRKIAPLKPAADALSIDTTNMNMDEVFEKVVSVIGSVTPVNS